MPVYCLLDEAGHTRIPDLATVITTIRKYQVSISLILQSLSQLETAYGKTQANTITKGGVASQIYYSGLDLETCQQLEQILGTVSREEKDKAGNTFERHKPLMDAQSIRMMKDKTALYLFRNKKPTLLRLTPYFKHIRFSQYASLPSSELQRHMHETPLEYMNLED